MASYSSILAGRIHGQRSLVGYSPWGHRESNTTERLHVAMLDIGTLSQLKPLRSYPIADQENVCQDVSGVVTSNGWSQCVPFRNHLGVTRSRIEVLSPTLV